MKNTSVIFALVSIIAAALLQQVSAESALSNLPTAEQRGQELYARTLCRLSLNRLQRHRAGTQGCFQQYCGQREKLQLFGCLEILEAGMDREQSGQVAGRS